MLRFIHTYAPGIFSALQKSGLWREGDGLKLMHKPGFLPPDDFNHVAAVGSPLEQLLSDLRCPFYIDRLQGGIGYTNVYPYDETLLSHYEALLGDRFLGFQMHEWASNFRSDQERISALFEKEGADPNDPDARKDLWERIVTGEKDLFLEAYSAKQWERRALSSGLAAFLEETGALYRLRAAETQRRLFPADSYYMAPRTEIENGARLLLPEAGWQIPNLRIQIAYTRGMANAAGIPWGIYYECWQNTENAGFTIPFSLREGQDEWLEDLLHTGNGSDLPFERREHGGSSLSVMARAWRFAWFSGAAYIAEEYGVCNTFRDLKTAELSPYGEVKRDFLRFIEKHGDAGKPYRPFGVVLPESLPMVDITFPEQWFRFPTETDAPFSQDTTHKINRTMELIFGQPGKHGNHGHVLKSGGLPDVFDMIHADTPTLPSYPYLIDLTGDPSFAERHPNAVSVGEADALLDTLLPFRVRGGLHTAYNKTEKGWLVLCMNNDGVYHDGFLPDSFLPEATVGTPVVFSGRAFEITKADGSGMIEKNGDAYSLSLGAGEWILLAAAEGSF